MSVHVSDVPFFSLGEPVPEVLECEFIIRQELVAGSQLTGYVSSSLSCLSLLEIQEEKS